MLQISKRNTNLLITIAPGEGGVTVRTKEGDLRVSPVTKQALLPDRTVGLSPWVQGRVAALARRAAGKPPGTPVMEIIR